MYMYMYVSMCLCVYVSMWGGGSTKKITASRGGHVKKIGKLRGVMQFLNGASRIPPAPPPPSLVKNERSLKRI